jgi:hypothetical protein
MASRFLTAAQVCNIVSSEEGDLDYIFPGSDDDFDAEDLQEEYDYPRLQAIPP